MLAKWQAEFVRKKILEATGVDAEIVIIKTTGDKMQQASFAQIGGRGVFIKELEEALLNEAVDLAVHSVKDIPTDVPSRLCFPLICRREDTRDCLISAQGETLATLRQGARVGTSSLRRQAQVRHVRPDLDVRELRGNVDTRLRKVESGEYDAILLAKAGLDRLGWSNRISEVLQPEVCLSPLAGALGVQAARKTRTLPTPSLRWTISKPASPSSRNVRCSVHSKAAARFRSALGRVSNAVNW
jgi:hydroxymethylbilane synthase